MDDQTSRGNRWEPEPGDAPEPPPRAAEGDTAEGGPVTSRTPTLRRPSRVTTAVAAAGVVVALGVGTGGFALGRATAPDDARPSFPDRGARFEGVPGPPDGDELGPGGGPGFPQGQEPGFPQDEEPGTSGDDDPV